MSTRVELTRQAEACLRQGRMDDAIARYQELAELAPVDWAHVKLLADLLERAGQPQSAAQQFVRWADHLAVEGFNAKAAALYKKVLKLTPRDEHALWQLGEVSLALKLRADARLAFQRVAELRQARGDASGAELARVRLAELAGAGPAGAPVSPQVVAAAQVPAAAEAPVEAPTAVPAPAPPQVNARPEPVEAVSQPTAESYPPAASQTPAHPAVAVAEPADPGLEEPLSELPVLPLSFAPPRERSEPAGSPDVAVLAPGSDPVSEEPRDIDVPAATPESTDARAAGPAAGHTLVFDWSDILGRDVEFALELESSAPADAHEPRPVPSEARESGSPPPPPAPASVPADVPTSPVAPVLAAEHAASDVAPSALDSSIAVESAADASSTLAGVTVTAGTETTGPAEAIEVTPPALPRVGALRAQPLFTEESPLQPSFSMPKAWLTADPASSEADPPHRRAPEDDFFFTDDATPARWAPRPSMVARENPPPARSASSEAPAEGGPESVQPPPGAPAVEPGGSAADEDVDLTLLLEELAHWDPELPEPRASVVQNASSTAAAPMASAPLDRGAPGGLPEGLRAADARAEGPIYNPSAQAPGDEDGNEQLDAVFADIQRHVDDRSMAEQQLAAGRVFLAAGLAAEAARAFERASAEPRTRFAASAALAELHRSRGQVVEAVRWYEQAAMAPAPDAAVKHAVLYDLAESLEGIGEGSRALGVLLDLLSQVEDYRDARARVDRLLRIDAGG